MEKKNLELINKLAYCQAMCNYCFNACLKEEDVKMMARCIKLDKECSEICGLAISHISSDGSLTKEILTLCVKACQQCAEECGKHDNDHCRECAKACKECAEACNSYL